MNLMLLPEVFEAEHAERLRRLERRRMGEELIRLAKARPGPERARRSALRALLRRPATV